MLKITIKNPVENSVLFNKSIDVKYETIGTDLNVKGLVFLINGIKISKNDYFGSFTVSNVLIGENEIIAYAINKNNRKILNTETRIKFQIRDGTVPIKTEMSLFCKLSIPEFILSDHTQFTTFIQKYYEFLEKSNTPYLVPFKQSDFYDIDKTSDYFIPFFRSQYMPDFPKILAIDNQTGTPLDLSKVIKNIKKFYESKGNLNSYKFLFRVLFDTEIDIKYPREKILKSSSGRWVQRKSIKIFSTNDSLSRELNNRYIYQEDENGNRTASARVRDMTIYRIDQYKVAELFIEDYIGIFNKTRFLLCDAIIDGAEETLSYVIGNCPISIQISQSGYNYKINDRVYLKPKKYVSITGSCYGDFSVEDINEVATDATDAWQFISNFAGGTEYSFISYDKNLYNELVDCLTTDTFIDIDGLNFAPLPFKYWKFDGNDFGFDFTIPGFAVTVGKGYIGRVSKVDSKGRILKIDAVNFGFNYESRINELYDVVVESELGVGIDATATIGILCEYAPFYSGNSGILSETNVLQDNYYYQSHSYEINTEIDINEYKDNVIKLVHPSGYRLFGKTRINKKNKNKETTIFDLFEINTDN